MVVKPKKISIKVWQLESSYIPRFRVNLSDQLEEDLDLILFKTVDTLFDLNLYNAVKTDLRRKFINEKS